MLTKLDLKAVTPHQMALGVAFGTLVSLFPTFGFGAIIAIALLPFLPQMNKAAVFFGLAFWNPLVQIPIYALSLEIGSALYHGGTVAIYHLELINQLATYALRFFIGHLAITILFTILSYSIVYFTRRFTWRKPETELMFS